MFDLKEKADLLGAADLFLTARLSGETFGLAHVEALQAGPRVLAYGGGLDRNHIDMLAPLAGLYGSPTDLKKRLLCAYRGDDHFNPDRSRAVGNQYRPENVAPLLEAALAADSVFSTIS